MIGEWEPGEHPRGGDGRFARLAARAADVGREGRTRTALPAGVETVPLATLRANITHTPDGFGYDSDEGWQDVMARQVKLSTTPAFLADIMRNGMQPIKVGTGAPGASLADADEIRDGNHRLAAAMLLGVTDVPVTRRDLADTDGNNKVPVEVGHHVGPLPAGADEVLARAMVLLAQPDPGHRALMDAELARLDAAAAAAAAAVEAENAAEDEWQRARAARREAQYQAYLAGK